MPQFQNTPENQQFNVNLARQYAARCASLASTSSAWVAVAIGRLDDGKPLSREARSVCSRVAELVAEQATQLQASAAALIEELR
jgi:hypothetical protein